MAMTEDQIKKNIRDTAESLGMLAYHTRNSFGSDRGFPDLVVAGPVGSSAPSVMYYETKGPRGVVSSDQQMWIDTLIAAGQIARIVFEADLPTVYDDVEAAFARHLAGKTSP
jgi:hypothetical protein